MHETKSRTHSVHVIGEQRQLVEERQVAATELATVLDGLRERLGPNVRILVDGKDAPASTLDLPPVARQPASVTDPQQQAAIQMMDLAHTMSWDCYDRAMQVQQWLLEQSSVHTRQLLDNNQRLADQAAELQRRHQAAMAELDFHLREQKLMEADEAARRLSRHIIAKSQAETAAHVAATQRTSSTLDDILDGIVAVVGGAATMMVPPRKIEDLN